MRGPARASSWAGGCGGGAGAAAAAWAVLLTVVALALAACGRDEPRGGGPGSVDGPQSPSGALERIGPYPRSQFYIKRDMFLAADEPECVPAAQASFLEDDDEVLGFVIRGKARAYAVTMLAYHHVVNDVVEGIPVAVTY